MSNTFLSDTPLIVSVCSIPLETYQAVSDGNNIESFPTDDNQSNVANRNNDESAMTSHHQSAKASTKEALKITAVNRSSEESLTTNNYQSAKPSTKEALKTAIANNYKSAKILTKEALKVKIQFQPKPSKMSEESDSIPFPTQFVNPPKRSSFLRAKRKVREAFEEEYDGDLGNELEDNWESTNTDKVENKNHPRSHVIPSNVDGYNERIETDSGHELSPTSGGNQNTDDDRTGPLLHCDVVLTNIDSYLKGRSSVLYSQFSCRYKKCGKVCRNRHLKSTKIVQKEPRTIDKSILKLFETKAFPKYELKTKPKKHISGLQRLMKNISPRERSILSHNWTKENSLISPTVRQLIKDKKLNEEMQKFMSSPIPPESVKDSTCSSVQSAHTSIQQMLSIYKPMEPSTTNKVISSSEATKSIKGMSNAEETKSKNKTSVAQNELPKTTVKEEPDKLKNFVAGNSIDTGNTSQVINTNTTHIKKEPMTQDNGELEKQHKEMNLVCFEKPLERQHKEMNLGSFEKTNAMMNKVNDPTRPRKTLMINDSYNRSKTQTHKLVPIHEYAKEKQVTVTAIEKYAKETKEIQMIGAEVKLNNTTAEVKTNPSRQDSVAGIVTYPSRPLWMKDSGIKTNPPRPLSMKDSDAGVITYPHMSRPLSTIDSTACTTTSINSSTQQGTSPAIILSNAVTQPTRGFILPNGQLVLSDQLNKQQQSVPVIPQSPNDVQLNSIATGQQNPSFVMTQPQQQQQQNNILTGQQNQSFVITQPQNNSVTGSINPSFIFVQPQNISQQQQNITTNTIQNQSFVIAQPNNNIQQQQNTIVTGAQNQSFVIAQPQNVIQQQQPPNTIETGAQNKSFVIAQPQNVIQQQQPPNTIETGAQNKSFVIAQPPQNNIQQHQNNTSATTQPMQSIGNTQTNFPVGQLLFNQQQTNPATSTPAPIVYSLPQQNNVAGLVQNQTRFVLTHQANSATGLPQFVLAAAPQQTIASNPVIVQNTPVDTQQAVQIQQSAVSSESTNYFTQQLQSILKTAQSNIKTSVSSGVFPAQLQNTSLVSNVPKKGQNNQQQHNFVKTFALKTSPQTNLPTLCQTGNVIRYMIPTTANVVPSKPVFTRDSSVFPPKTNVARVTPSVVSAISQQMRPDHPYSTSREGPLAIKHPGSRGDEQVKIYSVYPVVPGDSSIGIKKQTFDSLLLKNLSEKLKSYGEVYMDNSLNQPLLQVNSNLSDQLLDYASDVKFKPSEITLTTSDIGRSNNVVKTKTHANSDTLSGKVVRVGDQQFVLIPVLDNELTKKLAKVAPSKTATKIMYPVKIGQPRVADPIPVGPPRVAGAVTTEQLPLVVPNAMRNKLKEDMRDHILRKLKDKVASPETVTSCIVSPTETVIGYVKSYNIPPTFHCSSTSSETVKSNHVPSTEPAKSYNFPRGLVKAYEDGKSASEDNDIICIDDDEEDSADSSDHFVSGSSEERVVPGSSGEHVISGSSGERVTSGSSGQNVLSGSSVQHFISGSSGEYCDMRNKKQPRKSRQEARTEYDDFIDTEIIRMDDDEGDIIITRVIDEPTKKKNMFAPGPRAPPGQTIWPQGATIHEKKITLPDSILQELKSKPISEWTNVGQ